MSCKMEHWLSRKNALTMKCKLQGEEVRKFKPMCSLVARTSDEYREKIFALSPYVGWKN